MKQQDNFLAFRNKYPIFLYHSYAITETQQEIQIQFHFSIEGLSDFRPTWRFPRAILTNKFMNKISQNPYMKAFVGWNKDFIYQNCSKENGKTLPIEHPLFQNLAFSLGLVELVSYWKISCAPLVKILCGGLSPEQKIWWKKQYFSGLGEFFYKNEIETDFESFMVMESVGEPFSPVEPLSTLSGCLIPIGGGKDSIVTLDILKEGREENACYIINPRGATLKTAEVAGFSEGQIVGVWRTLDENMLRLNREGFLNGHTPFSALVAFSAVLAAGIAGKRYVVLSNESSANESTVAGSDVNHQYSKSFEFELDFSEYVQRYIGGGIQYFSLLRPWSEFQIACHFAKLADFYPIFRSCNVGSKTDSWCADCSKCLFVSIILSPFLTEEQEEKIFGSRMLDKIHLESVFRQLIGLTEEKPFECVGSVDEINGAICLAIEKREQAGIPLPALYRAYRQMGCYEKNREKAEQFFSYFNGENLLPTQFLEKMKQATAMLRKPEYSSLPLHSLPIDSTKPIDERVCAVSWDNAASKCRKGVFHVEQLLLDRLRHKRIVLLGFGREGKASYAYLRAHFPELPLAIADKNPVDLTGLTFVTPLLGENYQKTLGEYDLILRSPGIVLENPTPTLLQKLTCQTELFLSAFREQVIGITGTKGKSTTTSLIYHILKKNGADCLMMGNIGIPSFGLIDQMKPGTVAVYELSCHQLEYTRVSPKTAVLLNLFEEHLDHYGSLDAYYNAKRNIFRYQKSGDLYFCNLLQKDDLPVAGELITLSQGEPADIVALGDRIVTKEESISLNPLKNPLPGTHNVYNIAVAWGVCRRYGITVEQFLGALESYCPLPHRLQKVGTFQGVTYYDDSISTACETAIQAVNSLPDLSTILIGGMDRGIDYNSLVEFLLKSHVEHILLMPDTDGRIYQMMQEKAPKFGGKQVVRVAGLREAVLLAREVTPKGKSCLLSPAAASYGFFQNFEERGNRFQQYVREAYGM